MTIAKKRIPSKKEIEKKFDEIELENINYKQEEIDYIINKWGWFDKDLAYCCTWKKISKIDTLIKVLINPNDVESITRILIREFGSDGIKYDEFTNLIFVRRPLLEFNRIDIFTNNKKNIGKEFIELNDASFLQIMGYLQKPRGNYEAYFKGQKLSKTEIEIAISNIAQKNYHHSGKDRLLEFINDVDLKKYEMFKNENPTILDDWMIDVMNLDKTKLNKEYSKKWLMGFIGRMIDPGNAFQAILIIKGEQAIGKNYFLEKLCLEPTDYLSADFRDTENTTRWCIQTRGVWLVHFEELSELEKKEKASLKRFISNNTDEWVGKYKSYRSNQGRAWVPVGTTNEGEFLNDTSGLRRFWVVESNNKKYQFIKTEKFNEMKPYLFRLVYEEYLKIRENWDKYWLLSKEAIIEQESLNEKTYSTFDPVEDIIVQHIQLSSTKKRISSQDINDLLIARGMQIGFKSISNIMTSRLGWKKVKTMGRMYYENPNVIETDDLPENQINDIMKEINPGYN